MTTQWIDLALIRREEELNGAIKALQDSARVEVRGQLLNLLGLTDEELENSLLRVLIERARGMALPRSLWTRPLYVSSSIRDVAREHLEKLQVPSTSNRLLAMQAMYTDFADATRAKGLVTRESLSKTAFRCAHCGLRFCDEDLMSKAIVSPYGPRPLPIKVDPMKLHWSFPKYREPTADHDWPISTYGSNDDANIRILCQGCNGGKENILALEQLGAWTGLYNRKQLQDHEVPLSLFYAQLRRQPRCAKTGVSAAEAELTVALRDPQGPAILDNLMTVVSPDPT